MWINDLRREIKKCTRCRLSETRQHALCGEGNINARFFLIAQAPGEKEDMEGRMFIGPSGKVLDELLDATGIDRKEIYMTNLVKCMLPKNRRPKQKEIESCAPYLEQELEAVDPEVIVTLGMHAWRFVLEVHNLGGLFKNKLDDVCGRLLWTGDKKVMPLYHPAAMLHNPSLEDRMRKDYSKLGILRTECKWFSVCPMKVFYEAGRLDREWIELYCKGNWESCVRFVMEESGEAHPDWMLPDGGMDERLR